MSPFRLAVRRLLGAPAVTAALVLTIALGTGVNALVFSAVHGLLLRPLPFLDGDALVWVFAASADGAFDQKVTDVEGAAVAERMSTLESIAVIGDRGLVRAIGGRHDRWRGLWVTAALPQVLGITPAAGRAFTSADVAPGIMPMMISYERWQRDFASSSELFGRELHFEDNKTFRVIGVLPPSLEFPFARAPQDGNGTGFTAGVQDFWILGHDSNSLPGGFLIGRLGSGSSLAQARAESALLSGRRTSTPSAEAGRRRLAVVSMRQHALGSLWTALRPLQGFALVVLLLACVNIANLLFIQAARRSGEVAVKRALGARLRDLTASSLAEASVVAASGCLLGLVLARVGRAWIAATAASSPAIVERIQLDSATLTIAVAVAVVITIVLSVAPVVAWRAVRPAATIGSGATRATTRASRRGPSMLVVAQVTLSAVLLLGAVTLQHSLLRLLAVDPGYDASKVIAADTLLFFKDSRTTLRQVRDRLKALPGVEAVGLVHSTPLTGKWVIDGELQLRTDDGVIRTEQLPGSFVAFEYFEAMGIPVLAGRSFTDAEYLANDAPVIMINDDAARRLFPGQNPIGRTVRMFRKDREIVGVVKNTREIRLDTAPEPRWFQPLFFGSSQLIVRTTAAPAAVVPMIEAELRAADPRAIVMGVTPLATILDESVLERRLAADLMAVFAVVALVIAVVGLYGVVHADVSLRRRELGIRSALGAQRWRLAAMVVRQAAMMSAAGVGVALATWPAVGGLLREQLFEVRSNDPAVMTGVTAALLAIALVAAAVPAWTAATIEPASVLNRE